MFPALKRSSVRWRAQASVRLNPWDSWWTGHSAGTLTAGTRWYSQPSAGVSSTRPDYLVTASWSSRYNGELLIVTSWRTSLTFSQIHQSKMCQRLYFIDFLDRKQHFNHLNSASIKSVLQFYLKSFSQQQMLELSFVSSDFYFLLSLEFWLLLSYLTNKRWNSRKCCGSPGDVFNYFQRGPHGLKDIPVVIYLDLSLCFSFVSSLCNICSGLSSSPQL